MMNVGVTFMGLRESIEDRMKAFGPGDKIDPKSANVILGCFHCYNGFLRDLLSVFRGDTSHRATAERP